MDISIIIVNYNTRELLRNCLVSIFEQTKNIDFEVIVSDNASTDGSVEMLNKCFPQVILIENGENLGFGAANNRGLNLAKGKYILYLNSDTVLINNTIKIFYDYWEHSWEKEHLGAIGCNLRDSHGNVIHSYGKFPALNTEIIMLLYLIVAYLIKSILYCFSIRNFKLRKDFFSVYVGEVDYITGADLFLLNDVFACFDERFFLYFEEVDLEYKLKCNGKKRLIIDGPIIHHLEGGSDKKADYFNFSKQSIFLMSISKLLYFKKHTKSKTRIALIKFLTLILWLNPILIIKSRVYIKRMLNI
jgi:GT2 family glycosyltransferase